MISGRFVWSRNHISLAKSWYYYFLPVCNDAKVDLKQRKISKLIKNHFASFSDIGELWEKL
jgi:hypothetical protein